MRRAVLGTMLALAASLAAAAPGYARQEVQVALDRDDRILVVDARLAQRLGVFIERYPGFREARLFVQLPDSAYTLEVTAVVDGQTVRHRVPLSAAEADALRDDIAARIGARAPAAGLDREGRHRLLGSTALLGLGFYGWAVPYVLDIDHAGTAVGIYMLTAGTSFFAPWIATRERSVTRGMADLAGWGATRGIVHGLLLHRLLAGKEEDDAFFESDSRGEVASALVASAIEGVAGYALARDRRLGLGHTRTIGLGGDLGLLHGYGVTVLGDLDGRAAAGVALATGAAGLALGDAIASRRDYTAGDVTVLATAGYLGAYSAAALVDLTGTDDGRLYAAGAMVGNLVGLVAGDHLVRPTEFSDGQGRLVALGTLAGGAMGLGVAYLIVGDRGDGSAAYLNASALGALAGFGLTYRGLADDARRPTLQRGGLRLRIQPAGLAALAGGGAGGEAAGRPAVPVLTGSYRF